jgi:hypothetical protein
LFIPEEDTAMTLCFGLLPCLFLAPVAANEGLKVRADASRLVAGAVAADASWQAFPGFMADLEIECEGKVSRGRLIVEPDGRVFVEQVPDTHRLWAGERLGRVVRQRLPQEETANKSWMFVSPGRERTPFGHAVCRTDAPFGPCYWVQNQRFQAVEVRCARSRQRLTTLTTERSPDKKHLPAVQVLHRWDTQTLGLEATETTLLTWRREGRFDLPATVRALSAGAAAGPATAATGRIVLTGHRLFSSPGAIFASR